MLTARIRVVDANGQLVAYARQKTLSLKQDVTIFDDEAQTLPRYRLTQDRVLGYAYRIETADGGLLGRIKKHPRISRAAYELLGDREDPLASISEANAWVSLLDEYIGDIPFVSYAFEALLKPTYVFTEPSGTTPLRITKRPSVGEISFVLERTGPLSPGLDVVALPAAVLLTLLMRHDR